jgi:DNA-binding response OmpR family regulator
MPDILVIDDNPTQLCVREAVLRGAGFSVLTAESAEQALALLHDHAASAGLRVILTDHVLPGASGDAFVRELREFSPSVPVLVISGMDEAEQEYEGLDIKFLHKPCAPEDLITQVREALKSSG